MVVAALYRFSDTRFRFQGPPSRPIGIEPQRKYRVRTLPTIVTVAVVPLTAIAAQLLNKYRLAKDRYQMSRERLKNVHLAHMLLQLVKYMSFQVVFFGSKWIILPGRVGNSTWIQSPPTLIGLHKPVLKSQTIYNK